MESVKVNLADGYPAAVKDAANKIKKGDWVFDAHGGRHRVAKVRKLTHGRVKITRADGWPVTWPGDERVTYVPDDGRREGKARELREGDIVIASPRLVGLGRGLEVQQRHQVMKGAATISVRWADGNNYTFLLADPVTFIPAAARRPIVGQGATEHLHTDKIGYVVVAISKTGTVVHVAPLRTPTRDDGLEPAGDCNGFPVWDHEYTMQQLETFRETDRVLCVRRGRDGRWKSGRSPFSFDGARYFRNHAE